MRTFVCEGKQATIVCCDGTTYCEAPLTALRHVLNKVKVKVSLGRWAVGVVTCLVIVERFR